MEKTPGMLDYLAITSCDDGAVIDVSFRDCQDDPLKMEIRRLSLAKLHFKTAGGGASHPTTCNTCWYLAEEPVIPLDAKNLMTNSAKYAHYGPDTTKRGIHFGSLKACVDAAVYGINE